MYQYNNKTIHQNTIHKQTSEKGISKLMKIDLLEHKPYQLHKM